MLDIATCIVYIAGMKIQNQIKKTLSQPKAIEQIKNILDKNADINRTKLSDLICDHFNFYNPRGERQRSGCIKALRKLEQDGFFVLPIPCKTVTGKINPRRLAEPVPEPQKVPDEVGKICDLKLVLVEAEEYMRIWNELMIQDHPRGAGPLVGRQIRYLIQSEHGWLGGLSFSSAALHLEDRDKWIGWDWSIRQDNLQYVVNMSRFLIRSSIACKNLASCILGKVIKKLPVDFENRYNYRPLLLESFVDISHYKGTCYKAANWTWVGSTKGRGRQDLLKKCEETIKDIYVFALDKNFREKIGLSVNSGLDAHSVYTSIENENWAESEFGGAPVGDKRLSARLVGIATNKAINPGCAYSGTVGGNWPQVKGYYRLIDKPDDSAVTMSNILSPHREQTIRRMKAENTVLCIQDGSDLNYNKLDKCTGLGVIGSNQTGAISRGLHMHSTIAVTTDGLPLGVLHSECTAPEQKLKDDKRPLSAIPVEEKKTFCWIEGVRDCMGLKAMMPHTSLINIMDREADFFEMFDDQRVNCSSVDLLVRAKHNRGTTGEYRLFETARQSPVKGEIEIKIPRQSARTKKSKQKARAKRAMRIAKVSVRYLQIKLNPPSYHKDKDPAEMWVVHVREDNPPANTKRLEWFLLTTINIKSINNAIDCVKWYCLRWRIEDWHRVLKSGCKVEEIAHKTAERQKRAVAINMVIAWRIMLMTLLGREVPELPPEVLFSNLEIKVLKNYAKKKLKNSLLSW